MPILSITEIGYLAGIIDGEGCIAIRWTGRSNACFVVLTVANTCAPLVFWLHDRLGGSVHLHGRLADRPKRKPIWQWHASAGVVVPVLRLVLPHLIVKRRQAALVLEYARFENPGLRAVPQEEVERRRGIVDECRRLNKRGVA